MRLRNWLVTGTSIGLMALLPLTVRAQDGDLVAAYQAYVAAQASGDSAALETAQGQLRELCIVNGYGSIDECIAALAGGREQAPEPTPVPEPAPVPEPEPEPAPVPEPEPVIEEPAPEPVVEQPAPEPDPVVEEPAPAPEPVVEEPAPQPEPVIEEPAPQPEPAPAPEPEPAPEPQPAPEPAPQPAPEPAPEPQVEQPAPEPQPAPAVEEPVAAPADIGPALQEQVDLYTDAVAELMSGGDAAAAQAKMAAAQQAIADLCANAGHRDVNVCLAEYGLSLPAVPNLPPPAEVTEPADPTVPPAPPVEEPAEETPPVDAAPVEVIEELPPGITEEQLAPVLDSAKDADAQAPAAPPVDQTPPPPPPADDASAQSEAIQELSAAPIVSVSDEQGTAITPEELMIQQREAPQQLPQNVTIINQTVVNNVVNNNTTNNITNNTQNNIVDNSTNIDVNVQQNNVNVQPLNPGEAITQIVMQVGTQLIVNSIGQDTDRFYNPQQDEIFYENLSNGRVRETITRPDGSKIVTVRNRNGDVLRRSRFDPDGREYVLAYFDDRYDRDLIEWRDPGQDLPPLRLNIPVRDYVLDASYADEDEVEYFFAQPPVEQVARLYSIDEVKRSARIRDSVRKLEVGGLTFDTGAATIGRDQVGALSNVANAMLALLANNPGETFLIEGHTDAVGSEISNLRLSDLRAATVARILTDFYGVPPENLATQGYGERYLKIRTEAAERENRRVTIRRITPLITVASR